MPLWDFRHADPEHHASCERRYAVLELVFPSLKDTERARCPECGGELTRLPASGAFIITGYSSKNGYAK